MRSLRATTAVAGRRRGFTLLEVLVVVVIIAVLTVIAVLSIGVLGTDQGLDAEGDRYTDTVAAATEQAGLEGRDFGVWFGPARYEVLTYVQRRDRWEPLPDDRLYATHELPPGVSMRLEIEGKALVLGAAAPNATHTPQVLLYAGGEVSPYRLTLAREGSEVRWSVAGQADGTLVVIRPGATR